MRMYIWSGLHPAAVRPLAGRLATALELPFTDTAAGISCSFYDVQMGIAWRGGHPEWIDASGVPQGARAFAMHKIDPGDVHRVVRIEVSGLVRAWLGGVQPNDGMLLRSASTSVMEFHAREASASEIRPQLLLTLVDGRRRYLEPQADAALDCSTYKGVGQLPTLLLARDNTLALRFALPAGTRAADLKSAELILVRTRVEPAPALALTVFALNPPFTRGTAVRNDGIAAAYPGDRGLDKHPDVLFADGFDSGEPDRRWKKGPDVPAVVVESDPKLGFVALHGPALRVRVPRREQLGLDYRYRFRDHHGQEPEEIYFRYYLWLAPDWLGASHR
jgi:hypothetical protein